MGPACNSLAAPLMRSESSLRSASAPGRCARRGAKRLPVRQRPSGSLNHSLDFYADQRLLRRPAVTPTRGPPAALTVRPQKTLESGAPQPALLGSVLFEQRVIRVWSSWGPVVTA